MRIAVVVDWLYVFGGAERVLAAILECYPESDLFCLFDVLPDDARALLGGKRSRSTFLQKLPGIARNHRRYLPLMPIAIEQIDLNGYDLVLSSSHAVAKGVLTGPDQIHLSYVLSPMRYAWDLQHQYLREAQMTRGLKGSMARVLLHHMRLWDTRTANSVDSYAAISNFISRRVRKVYGREAEVIYPPVAVPQMLTHRPKEDFFLAASRLVSYKNIHCIVEAFRQLPAERLIVVGEGPEAARLRASAGPNVSMVGFVSGVPWLYQMVERKRQIQVPKYLRPRTDTPKLTIGHGGCFGCIDLRSQSEAELSARFHVPVQAERHREVEAHRPAGL